jgi:hypothetical protein
LQGKTIILEAYLKVVPVIFRHTSQLFLIVLREVPSDPKLFLIGGLKSVAILAQATSARVRLEASSIVTKVQ